jgi:hypothetical protein
MGGPDATPFDHAGNKPQRIIDVVRRPLVASARTTMTS